MKILVVDDEWDAQDLFKQRFRKEIKSGSMEPLFAMSGEEAIKILSDLHPMDIVMVFSDINMPGMSGFELLSSIKIKFPQLKVYLVSAYGDHTNLQRAIDLGADDFIHKPVDYDIVKTKLTK
ncbi:MAG: response regulator [Bacteroidetes bacterium]|nr:response regulator [Bacteroidota bacterium]